MHSHPGLFRSSHTCTCDIIANYFQPKRNPYPIVNGKNTKKSSFNSRQDWLSYHRTTVHIPINGLDNENKYADSVGILDLVTLERWTKNVLQQYSKKEFLGMMF
jgi:hypothetical protein